MCTKANLVAVRGECLLVVALAEVGRPEVAVRAALSRQVRELLSHHEVLFGVGVQWYREFHGVDVNIARGVLPDMISTIRYKYTTHKQDF